MSSYVAFNEQLLSFYLGNKKRIRKEYNTLTRKFLDYNDSEKNSTAFLRKPQFEALEIYVFIKEFAQNAQVHEIFNDWRLKRNIFEGADTYITGRDIEDFLYADDIESTEKLFRTMKKASETYPNYIYALAMGLGKTVLMATCVYYEFLLANKFPKDKRYCHNALIFAPDKTVLESLREIITLDKSKVVPREYVSELESRIKVHFLLEGDLTLNTIDGSEYNLIITNTQKIIAKKKHKEDTPIQQLFNKTPSLLTLAFGEDYGLDRNDLVVNQRLQKLYRLSQLGIYVDEAHHLFGDKLQKDFYDKTNETSLRSTINILADELLKAGTSVIACYNYTGTPYVKKQVLPEVVYAYGLGASIANNYLKEAAVMGFENVKNSEFIEGAITEFWKKYGGKTYEELTPKMAIFAASVDEANNTVKPMVESILTKLGIDTSKVIINVGDERITKNEDIKNFNDLDVKDSVGNSKQFIILVEKGREGWNCRSLFSVALYRKPSSKIFVLQATMRCLRKITDERQEATVFLSKENTEILNKELNNNFNIEIKDLKSTKDKKMVYEVKFVPPKRMYKLKSIVKTFSLEEKKYNEPINFNLDTLDSSNYQIMIHKSRSISRDLKTEVVLGSEYKEKTTFTLYTLIAEISRYMNISPILVSKILRESVDGEDIILEQVNLYNEVLYDHIISRIFHGLYNLTSKKDRVDKEIVLLHEPKNKEHYSFTCLPELVIKRIDEEIEKYKDKSFHADTYCFDSKPEMNYFLKTLVQDEVKNIYFTGMFTANQGDFSIEYYDSQSQAFRNYYPDFLVEMIDGSIEIIEIKADYMVDDVIVKAKEDSANELAFENKMIYRMFKGSLYT